MLTVLLMSGVSLLLIDMGLVLVDGIIVVLWLCVVRMRRLCCYCVLLSWLWFDIDLMLFAVSIPRIC